MTRLTLIALTVAALLFVAAWFLFPDVSSLPLCWFISASLCGFFYAVDRIGFAAIDTIETLELFPHLYVWYMVIYACLIVIGHVLGLGAIG